MPVPVLESSLNQAWNKPLPSSIGHDIHRATGWNTVIALHLQPGVARLFGAVHYAENPEEMEVVRNILDETISRNIADLDQEKVTELTKRLGTALSANGFGPLHRIEMERFAGTLLEAPLQ